MHTCPNCGKDVDGGMTDPCPRCGFDPMAAAGGSTSAPAPAAPPATGPPTPKDESGAKPLRIPRGVTTGGTVPAPAQRASIFHAIRSMWRRRRDERS